MSNPSAAIAALVQTASFYPPATAYHFAVCEAEGVRLVGAQSCSWAQKELSFMDVAIAHVIFSSDPRKLKASVEREAGWVKGQALTWMTAQSPYVFKETWAELEAHIIDAFSTMPPGFEESDLGKKKAARATASAGFLPSPKS